jgi:hypothetical protein
MVTKHVRKDYHILNTKLKELTLQTCVQNVLEDGTNTIILVKTDDLHDFQRFLSANPPKLEPNLDVSSERNREALLERPARRRR